jgi:4-nitrophenyl phosphatase
MECQSDVVLPNEGGMDKQQFLDLKDLVEKYDFFLFDCDGVLWHGDHEIEQAFAALRYI